MLIYKVVFEDEAIYYRTLTRAKEELWKMYEKYYAKYDNHQEQKEKAKSLSRTNSIEDVGYVIAVEVKD